MLMNSWTLLRLRTCLCLKKLKVKSLELELSVAREQVDRSSTSKVDGMVNVQKSVSDKTGLGFVESGSSSIVHPPKFVPATSYFCCSSIFIWN